jgi:hypothetical protein
VPPPKSDARTIVIIVAVVVGGLMVGLPALLYIMVTSSLDTIDTPPAPSAEVVLVPGTWDNGNLTISFASITGGQRTDPSALTYLVQSPNGTTFFSGPADTGPPVQGVSITVAYQDNAMVGLVSPEDTIRLAVAPSTSTSIRGGSFRVFVANTVIGTIQQLP